MKKETKKEIFSWIWTLAVAFVIALFLNHYIIVNANVALPLNESEDKDISSVYNKYLLNLKNDSITGENAVITFTIPAANIGLIYQRCIEGYRGQYDVYIDDKYVTTLDGNFDRGKGTETDTIELYRSDRVETHNITIIKSADSENYMFTILGLLIS